ncbi:MBL fold metallo-hydrolase [Lacibacter luteus]|uniref:MBL fold metallo-hydrolase n=1 Tax=Lacibacter luteus TaxID=2508719 RepID=A0A4Q1CNP1_9BACT|nr:MBL fold metallo-hydrolase [Lacibacter luteus]RXK62748.1 MBL fold metallo-hydrolase [Lacibacter luteus]
MPVYFTSLNSGSNANCYYVSNGVTALLFDAGLSCRETEKRMQRLGLDIKQVKAIFISHEHSDHINGLEVLSKKHQLPVYVSEKTWNNTNLSVDVQLLKHFRKDEVVMIDELQVKCFSKSHDAADPFSFMISCQGVNVSVITDIGHACKNVIRYFQQSHAVFLESNYCETMLANGDYPYHLKRRVSSDEGHLSNEQALDVFLSYRTQQLQFLILSHLSKNNNTPQTVDALFQPHAGTTKVIVASRYEESELFSIDGITTAVRSTMLKKKKQQPDQNQLSLF